MASSTSSAQPEELYRYADRGTRIDQELIGRAQALAGTLHHFEATCREYHVSVSYLADDIVSYGRQAQAVDDWVRRVGEGFARADRLSWLAWLVTHLGLDGLWARGAALGALPAAAAGVSLKQGPLALQAQTVLERIWSSSGIWPPLVRLPQPVANVGLTLWLLRRIRGLFGDWLGWLLPSLGTRGRSLPFPWLSPPRAIFLPSPSWPPFVIQLPPRLWPPLVKIGIAERWPWLLPTAGVSIFAGGGLVLKAIHDMVDGAGGRVRAMNCFEPAGQVLGAESANLANLEHEYAGKSLTYLLQERERIWKTDGKDPADRDKRLADNEAEQQRLGKQSSDLRQKSDSWWNRTRPSDFWHLEVAPAGRRFPPWRTASDGFQDENMRVSGELDWLQREHASLIEGRLRLEAVQRQIDVALSPYDGKTYADGTYNAKDSYSARTISPPLERPSGITDPKLYEKVLYQFGVTSNPRYAPRNGNTYCNIYVWDATRAMGAEIPHWIDASGNPVTDRSPVNGDRELDANGVCNWLATHENKSGWHTVSAERAQDMANEGHPVVATWPNSGGIGHVAMVRPVEDQGEYSTYSPQLGPLVAQAGSHNSNEIWVSNAFYTGFRSQNNPVVYYAHD